MNKIGYKFYVLAALVIVAISVLIYFPLSQRKNTFQFDKSDISKSEIALMSCSQKDYRKNGSFAELLKVRKEMDMGPSGQSVHESSYFIQIKYPDGKEYEVKFIYRPSFGESVGAYLSRDGFILETFEATSLFRYVYRECTNKLVVPKASELFIR